MCGIAGMLSYTSAISAQRESQLLALRDAMVSRGPDAAGFWINDSRRIALAHRRLAIIDLSENGQQPMSTPDGRYSIVFNGEIYNYLELKKNLEQFGLKFRTASDTEVLLHYISKKGVDGIKDLRGMFAFALWDEVKKELILARDSFGMKPLYYADTGKELIFSSQAKSLIKVSGVDSKLSAPGVTGFFLFGWVPEPYTIYRGIRQVPAGAVLTAKENGSLSISSTIVNTSEIIIEQNDDHKTSRNRLEKLHSLLVDSVKHHLISDVPLGFFLSSGLDSTLLVEIAKNLGTNVEAVTLGFKELAGGPNDETNFSAQTAKRLGIKHQVRWIGKEDLEASLPHFISAMDQPTTDGLNTYLISKAARDSGLTVAISGLGGDELFGGYPSFEQIPKLAKVGSKIPYVQQVGAALRKISAPLISRYTSPKYASLFEYSSNYWDAYLLRRGLFMPWELPSVMDPLFAADGYRELRETFCSVRKYINQAPALRAISALETSLYMKNQLLRDSDWASMAHSLEIRVPLVDNVLLRESLKLLKKDQLFSKKEMISGIASNLPTGQTARKKTGFVVPVQNLLANQIPELKERGHRGWARWVFSQFSDCLN